ncbi:AAA family ATPase [Mycoplasmoides genitalium]|uniref:Chaperone protein ClpB n=1 Tax=Mycoplasma genitalium (strain ATCC 33530 / DSM 19775 / NCTC 10195 / G37) TaxID=243273 RepID=CLPB_MYCGE|nr:AAA family ATPase [Mycoplasmoides genitalium]P47597.1 RecName: Full=Chaperone protein ClpB [Mycoplasmoides genitalium G37]AAC71580.1 ATP-dependent Clp protease, ATPase subunit [Mycoplasmoides genitalium G37]ABY79679.1 ATP-dependent Clp protease, ATPase subunit [synthetic Mycoplasma genitalium JCVI-1.0]
MNINFTPAGENRNFLQEIGRNINDEVLKNKVDPIIGRDNEIRRLIEILSRKSKNNPVLIGEPGVGKTAIVEGFVRRVVSNDVPLNLRDVEIYELSLSGLIAGTKFQGEFEKRINTILKQVKESNGRIILFIDEIHQIVGLGRNSSSGAMDIANILKPMLARGEIKVIGATTLKEYREYIEKDGALERRFQKILINEPSSQEALTIMRGLKTRWELFHNITIFDSALVAAVEMSTRYINERNLPDKAIDLIDEAAAKIKTEMSSEPVAIDSLKREIINLETEYAALKQDKENDNKQSKKEYLEKLKKQLDALKQKRDSLINEWKKEKADFENINKLKKEIEEFQTKLETYQSEGNYESASKILYSDIPRLKKELESAQQKYATSKHDLFKTEVSENEIAEVISQTTGIPLKKLLESEKDKLLHLGDEIKKRVKGQDEAIDAVVNTVIRGRVNINDPNKPIGSFIFLGSTGVGKTELAKSLAEVLFDNEKALIRFDMSEYMEKHSVAKLIGAPPGYIGYEQSGLLTEAVRRKPYSVLLFDEIEKAHPDVTNVLLQVLDDGTLKDSQGRVVNFKNTLIIMTSNLGSNFLLEGKKDLAIQSLKKHFRPEFINRIDEIVFFNVLEKDTVLSIINSLLAQLSKRLNKQNLFFNFDSNLTEFIYKSSFDQQFGARPIKRFIDHSVATLIAKYILQGKIKKGVGYNIAVVKDNITITQNNKS